MAYSMDIDITSEPEGWQPNAAGAAKSAYTGSHKLPTSRKTQ